MKFEWTYYPKYDISVNIQTGELSLPICECKLEYKCCFLKAWEEDGCPTHIDKEELKRLIKFIKDNDEE